MLSFALFLTLALAVGAATAWHTYHRLPGHRLRAPLAATAGTAAFFAVPSCLLVTLIAVPGLGIALGLIAGIAAITAYDQGRIWTGTAWAATAATAFGCAGWSL